MDRTPFLALLALAGAGCNSHHGIVVGSKNFTEQLILGEIVAQHLEHRLHQPVTRRLNLGGTLLAHQALVNGEIDVYPEYTGTALTAILKQPPSWDAAATLATLRREYKTRWNLEVLDPLGFENTFAMVARGPEARAAGLKTLSQAANYKPGWALGVGYEFLTRPDGWPSLERTYHLPLEGNPRSMDLGLLYRALEQKQVSLIAANSTDGQLTALDVVALTDDRRAFPPYHAVLVARAQNPVLTKTLSGLSGCIREDEMRRLNFEVDNRHIPVAQVARQFLQAKRLD